MQAHRLCIVLCCCLPAFLHRCPSPLRCPASRPLRCPACLAVPGFGRLSWRHPSLNAAAPYLVRTHHTLPALHLSQARCCMGWGAALLPGTAGAWGAHKQACCGRWLAPALCEKAATELGPRSPCLCCRSGASADLPPSLSRDPLLSYLSSQARPGQGRGYTVV